MNKFKIGFNPFIANLVSFVFLFTIVLSNTLGESLLAAASFSLFWCAIGLFIEFDHRKKANEKISKHLYSRFQKNSIQDPDAIFKSPKLQFLRLWNYSILWPRHLYILAKAESINMKNK